MRDAVRAAQQTPGRATLLELWANAERRAGQGRYDDAVGRLYRAVELRAQQLVRDAYGVELGQIAPNAFPPAQGDAVRRAFREPDDAGRYKSGLRPAALAVCAVSEAEIPRWPELTLTLPE